MRGLDRGRPGLDGDPAQDPGLADGLGQRRAVRGVVRQTGEVQGRPDGVLERAEEQLGDGALRVGGGLPPDLVEGVLDGRRQPVLVGVAVDGHDPGDEVAAVPPCGVEGHPGAALHEVEGEGLRAAVEGHVERGRPGEP